MNDSWLIIGPGRTGSQAIARSLYSLYKFDFDKIKYIDSLEQPKPIGPGTIVHAHNMAWFNIIKNDINVVISTRNPVESALSWVIRPKLVKYHFFGFKEEDINEHRNIKITKFHVTKENFLFYYNKAMNFYNNLRIKKNWHVLDYSDWSSDPTQILKKLNFNVNVSLNELTIKNPGKHSDWIENYEEINDLCKTLVTKAPLIFRD